MQKLISQLGTPKDTPDIRHRLQTLTEDTRGMIKQTSSDLKQLGGSSSSSQFEERQRKIAQQKLQKDFEDVLNRFQSVSKLAASKSREYVYKARVQQQLHEEEEHSSESQSLLQSSQRVEQLQILDNEIDYNEALIQEREEDLQNIERSIIEVNEIFRDLGTLVHEQQPSLGIYAKICPPVSVCKRLCDNAFLQTWWCPTWTRLQSTWKPTGELRTAARYQKLSRDKLCCLYIFLGVVATVVLVVIIS
ncbi:t-SNARE [Zopfochytrium polystomum]|nr:t-SNARE [Zopfochytrium polystomum]